MATSIDFIKYVAEQISGVGDIRYKKMFGEYMVYINEKPLLLVCDDTVYIKILPCTEELMSGAEKGYPYTGAKEHYILDIDNAGLAKEAAAVLELNTPLPKPKKAKQKQSR